MPLTKLWSEVYRPRALKDLVFGNERERKFFEHIVESKSLPNLMLVGAAGTGKTSLSGVLLNELQILPEDMLRVNCSDDKIEKIRGDVKNFAYTMASGDFKVVQLEEMDYLSLDAQALLRNLIEEVSSSCRFIVTANYVNKIIPAIRDRFHVQTFAAPNRDDVLLRAAEILEREKVSFEVEDLEKIVSAGYPSVRKIIHMLEAGSKTGKLVLLGEGAVSDWKLSLLLLLEKSDLKGSQKLICESATKEELPDVFKFLGQNLERIPKLKDKQDQAVVMLAQYLYQSMFVSDAELQVRALLIELNNL